MSTYAIGDIQGCYEPLQQLLELIHFNESTDTLWFTGDLVNRGPNSLSVLRFIKQLKGSHRIVLGNHDLHFLAVAHGAHPGWEEDTFQDILQAPDRDELIAWLLQQPLLQHDSTLGYTMIHAGLASQWNLHTAQLLAREVENNLQKNPSEFLAHMYGNEPNDWRDDLQGWDRLRCITNYLTRARFCYPDGRLELKDKNTTLDRANKLIPWFQIPHRLNQDLNIIFGHWAALGGITHTPNVYALDTGCVWGFSLTAMRLEDQERISIGCPKFKELIK